MVEYTILAASSRLSGCTGAGVSVPSILNAGAKPVLIKISEAFKRKDSTAIFSSNGCGYTGAAKPSARAASAASDGALSADSGTGSAAGVSAATAADSMAAGVPAVAAGADTVCSGSSSLLN